MDKCTSKMIVDLWTVISASGPKATGPATADVTLKKLGKEELRNGRPA